MPTTVANFVKLVRNGAYKGTVFSKVQTSLQLLVTICLEAACIPFWLLLSTLCGLSQDPHYAAMTRCKFHELHDVRGTTKTTMSERFQKQAGRCIGKDGSSAVAEQGLWDVQVLPGEYIEAGRQGSPRLGEVKPPTDLLPNTELLDAQSFRSVCCL